MDKETQNYIDDVASRAATEAVAKMREFHLDDLKVLGEQMELGFESVDRRFDAMDGRLDGIDVRLDGIDVRLDGIDVRLDKIEVRLDQVENVLAALMHEMKEYRENVDVLKKQISELTLRVEFLENKLASAV